MSNYHQHMIDLMKSLGYQINDNGMCHGIVMMGVQAFLSHELPKFEQRLKFIEEHRHALLKQLNELKTRLATLAADNKQREQLHLLPQPILFTSDEESFIDTWAFLEGVALYFDPTIYPQQFGELLHQNDTEKISALTSSLSLDKLGGLKKIAAWPGMYKKDELSHYLFLLDQYIRAGNQDIALTFASENHSIAFAYDTNTQQWLLIDSNELPPPVISVEKWAEIVTTKFGESNTIGFETLIHSTGNHASAVKKIIENVKQDVVFQDLHEITPEKAKRVTLRNASLLYFAARSGHKDIVAMLIDKGADINHAPNNNVTPLFIAAQNGHKDIVEIFINKGTDINRAQYQGATPLLIAAENGHNDIVKMLIEKGAHINQAQNQGVTPLLIAAQNGHNDIVKMLIKNGAHINQARNDGVTPLLIAAQNGHNDIVKMLIKNGAHINQAQSQGAIPLLIATQIGHKDIVKILIKNGAHINQAQSQGATPLFIAALQGYNDIVKILIEIGADINQAENNGVTPLLIAAQNGHKDIVKMLIEKGAHINQTKNNGAALLFIATQNGHETIIDILLTNQKNITISFNNSEQKLLEFASKRNVEESMRGLIEYKKISQNESSSKITITPL